MIYKVLEPTSYGVPFLQSRISMNGQVLYVSFAGFRWKETNEMEIKITLQMQ